MTEGARKRAGESRDEEMQLEREAEREDGALINYTENKAERGKDKGENVLKFRFKKRREK